jgi:hypothetical protein
MNRAGSPFDKLRTSGSGFSAAPGPLVLSLSKHEGRARA